MCDAFGVSAAGGVMLFSISVWSWLRRCFSFDRFDATVFEYNIYSIIRIVF